MPQPSPVLQPPPVLIQLDGRIDEPVKRAAMSSRTIARAPQPDVVLEKPLPLWVEPLAIPVKKMLAVGRNLAESMKRLADDLDRAMEERQEKAHLLGRVASFSGLALSAGFAAWILRSGSLLASFLVSMPAWRHFDPLPVLGSAGSDRRKQDRKAKAEQEREAKMFRGMDRVLKNPATGRKPTEDDKGQQRRPK